MKNIVVVGGGAAGMMAAIQSAGGGHKVVLIEKNEKLGKKLFITGKGRCNLTNACDVSALFHNIVSNPKFLYSAFYSFSNTDTVDFFHSLGLKTKIERGERVFPLSDKSSDVIRLLEKECMRLGVTIYRNTKVKEIKKKENRVTGVSLQDGAFFPADRVILATGGLSYPSTGSTGDGYKMAEKLGHTVTRLRPGLTGMTVKEESAAKMQGLTLKNTAVSITEEDNPKKKYYEGYTNLRGVEKEGTQIDELKKMSNEKDDFTEKDIELRNENIINEFLNYLKLNDLIK